MRTRVLAGLLLVWVSATFWVSLDDLKLRRDAEDELNRRAFLVYSRMLAGCMMGASYSNANYPFVATYEFCKNLAYGEKDIYLKGSK